MTLSEQVRVSGGQAAPGPWRPHRLTPPTLTDPRS